jgi:phosphoglycerol transferase
MCGIRPPCQVSQSIEELMGAIRIPGSREAFDSGDAPESRTAGHSKQVAPMPWLAALLALVAIAWCTGTGRWTAAAWNTPLQYADGFYCDVVWTFAGMKATADGHNPPFFWKTVPELGAPFEANWNDWPVTEEIPFFAFGLLAKVFGVFAGLNLALLVGHLLAAATMFLVARGLDCSNRWAFVAALAYGLAPFIFAQSPHHITVAYAWHVPLFLLVWKWVATDPGLELGTRRFWWALGIAFLAGLQNVYYTNILCQITLLGAGFRGLRSGSFMPLKPALAVIGAAAAAFALMNLDTWTFRAVNGPNAGAVVREYKWLEIYGLKLIDLVVPPVTHHFQPFADFARAHRAAAPLQDEGSYLGLVGLASLGLLAAGAIGAVVRNRANAIPMEAWQVLWIVLCFATGGLNAILGAFGFTLFRTGCRYSVVILAIALVYAARRLTAVERLAAFRVDAETLRIGTIVAAIAAGIVVLWDQVPAAPRPEQTAAIAGQVEADRRFVAQMEAALPAGAMVFQLPIIAFPEEPAPGVPPYDHFRPYLHSHQLRFSFGSMKGRAREQWQQELAKVPFEKAVEEIKGRGFAAISINRNGFPDKGRQLVEKLRGLGHDKPPIESAAGDLVCVPLTR